MKTNKTDSATPALEPEYIKYIVEGIKEVLKYDIRYLMAWGAKELRPVIFNGMAALHFNVNGYLFNGNVVIAYKRGADLYEVYCLTDDNRIAKEWKEIYYDELVDVIDSMVEKEVSQEQYDDKIVAQYGTETIEALRTAQIIII